MSAGFSADGVLAALRMQTPRSPGAGRALMIISARAGEGASPAARAIAKAAGPQAAYAIDLDVRSNALARSFAAEAGALGPRIEGRLNGALFYDVVGAQGRALAAAATFFFHRVGRARLFVGVFDGRAAPKGARIRLSGEGAYWNAARAGGATVIVEAPALEQSPIGLRVARHMDGVVLVVGDDAGAAPAAMAAKAELARAGAPLMGLIYAGAPGPAEAIERFLRKAG